VYSTIDVAYDDLSQKVYKAIETNAGIPQLVQLQGEVSQLAAEADRRVQRLKDLKANIDQKEVKTVTLPTGSREITQINAEIARQIAEQNTDVTVTDPSIRLTANSATLNSVIEILNHRYAINMANSAIRSVLGFSGKILTKTSDDYEPITVVSRSFKSGLLLNTRRYESDQPVNIMPISSILVKCSVIAGSYVAGSEYPVLYSFFPGVGPGYKIIERPQHVVYLPVTLTGNIQTIRMWLTDQAHSPLDLRGEHVTIRCALESY
jgi:hypothetical protein